MNPEPVGRFQWSDLPTPARDAITERFGQVRHTETTPRGLTVGVASRLHTETGDVFLKAIPVRSPAVGHHWREHQVGQTLPTTIPTPHLKWSARVGGWLMLAFEHIPGRDADLSPGSADIPRVLDTLAALPGKLTPCPWPAAPEVTIRLSAMASQARETLSDPPADTEDTSAACASAFNRLDLGATEGETLVHGDIHAANLHITPEHQVFLLDWSLAARGAPWLDALRLVPRLISAGHTPAQAEAAMNRLPAWAEAPADAATSLAAMWALFAAHMAAHGPRSQRQQRERSMQAGAAWVQHRSSE